MSIWSRTTAVNVRNPIPKVRWVQRYETTRTAVAIVAWSTLGFVVVATIIFSLLFKLVQKIDTPPPKVITKTVYRDALTAAQQTYIKDCEADTHSANDGYNNQGVPDVHTPTWTCTFPN